MKSYIIDKMLNALVYIDIRLYYTRLYDVLFDQWQRANRRVDILERYGL